MDYKDLAKEFSANMSMLNASRPHRDIDRAMQGEMFVLHFLADRDEEILPGEISAQMNVSSARVAQALNNIEKKGWITRHIDPADRRRILVNLTHEGKTAVEAHVRNRDEMTANMLSLLGEEDAKEYVRLVGKLAREIAKQEQRRSPDQILRGQFPPRGPGAPRL